MYRGPNGKLTSLNSFANYQFITAIAEQRARAEPSLSRTSTATRTDAPLPPAVMAEDPDAGANGEVRFSLGEGGDAALFAVDAQTGWVTTRAALDREARAELRVPLLAEDGAAPPARRSARGSLVVRLLDYNDSPPRFEPAALAAAVAEDAPPGTVVARLRLEDADAAAAPLAFLLAAGDPRARFQLRASGELLVARALDRELEPAYELTVIATDGKFDARATVAVTVTDVNGEPARPAPRAPRARPAPC